jgi:hypothetical protein
MNAERMEGVFPKARSLEMELPDVQLFPATCVNSTLDPPLIPNYEDETSGSYLALKSGVKLPCEAQKTALR